MYSFYLGLILIFFVIEAIWVEATYCFQGHIIVLRPLLFEFITNEKGNNSHTMSIHTVMLKFIE